MAGVPIEADEIEELMNSKRASTNGKKNGNGHQQPSATRRIVESMSVK
jgi:hypothetical protein